MEQNEQNKDKDILKMFQQAFNQNNRPLSPKEQAIANDHRLSDLALYAVTSGLIKKVTDPQIVQDKFVEFKRLVKSGEFTIEELENKVCEDFGVTNKPKE